MRSDPAPSHIGETDDGPGTANDSDLSWSQTLLWAGQALAPDAPLYNMVLTFEIEGPLDHDHFERAFRSVLDRSDALRTVVGVEQGVPSQKALDPFEWHLHTVDLSREDDPPAAAREWAVARARTILDPSVALFDTALLTLGEGRHVWYLNQHHLITDAWSTGLVYAAVEEAYGLSVAGRLDQADPLPRYADYVAQEHATADTELHRRAREHWAARMDSIHPVAMYGKDKPRSSTRTERLTVDLGRERSAAIRELAAGEDARSLTDHLSRFNVITALLVAFLHRVSGQTRISVGTPSHNRPTAELKDTIGAFIEVFPLTLDLDATMSFRALIRAARSESGTFLRYARPRTSTTAGNRAFNVVLNYINATFPQFDGLEMRSEWVHPGHGDLSHDLRLQVHDFDESGTFSLHFDLSVERFDERERDTLVRHFLRLLDGFLANPDASLHEPALIESEEQRSLVDSTNPPRPTREDQDTVLDRFERTVRETPDHVAVEFGNASWTYQELNARAERVSDVLSAHGAAGGVVALYMGRSPQTLVGILGALKAGAAYLPLDPINPPERTAFILDDAFASVVLTDTDHQATLPATAAQVVNLGTVELTESSLDTPRPPTAAGPGDVAYIIYTSGSTGEPKGVMVDHRSLAEYVFWAESHYMEGSALAFPFFTPLSFDLTITSIFTPLVGGGRVVIYDDDPGAVDQTLLQVIEDDRVDVIKLTPAHLALLRGRDVSALRVRTLILGGEDLKTDLARSTHVAFGGRVTIYNEYGPTEATVGCVVHRYDPETDKAPSVPIGRPAAQARVYVLDDCSRQVPPGVTGEIAIGGPGVARGYLNRPELTSQRFSADPYVDGQRIYRTGDLGRWARSGQLEYLGRSDRQIKLHGLRIEPGEIEAVLRDSAGIEECVVTVSERPGPSEPEWFCSRCGLPSNYPGVTFDENRLCSVCSSFDGYADRALRYFGTRDELREILERARSRRTGDYDCLMLLSGGKDSSYALYQLVAMGLDVLTATLDNGYISDGAKGNIRRVTEELGVDHVYLSTPAMNEIFVDSLRRHSNVCQGCFKAMYTLSIAVARERGIPAIVTGLSKGQFFETRLPEELFWNDAVTAESIDKIVLDARKAYHRVDDAVNRLLDTTMFETDDVFADVEFVDFYRYSDVSLTEMLNFLDENAPWIRPADTGRSTNCLINDTGIYVHKQERGYHNYALPYAWDVRLGHKNRDEALAELNDDIDVGDVLEVLDEIGFVDLGPEQGAERLTAYFTGSATVDPTVLRSEASARLPGYMVPSEFVRIESLPITPNGKIDMDALARRGRRRAASGAEYVAPRDGIESALAGIWGRALRVERVGARDNFFDLGGDSITAIQIGARARAIGLPVDPNHVFAHQTIAELAAALPSGAEDATSSSTGSSAARDDVAASELSKALELLERADNAGGGT